MGGKWRSAERIIATFPGHRVYVEPFGGSAAILLNKAPAPIEIYNDICDEVVNFFKILRTGQSEKLATACRLTPYSRREAELSTDIAEDDPLENARRFLVRSWMGIASDCTRRVAIGYRISRHRYPSPAMDWETIPERLQQAAVRLKNVHIEHADAVKIMQLADAPDTLHYVDPPYMMETRTKNGRYRHEYTASDHERLLSTLREMKGMVCLSGYDSPLYTRTLHDWHRITFDERSNMGGHRRECLWTNYDHTPMLPGLDGKEEV